jgi:hypothetical protein
VVVRKNTIPLKPEDVYKVKQSPTKPAWNDFIGSFYTDQMKQTNGFKPGLRGSKLSRNKAKLG